MKQQVMGFLKGNRYGKCEYVLYNTQSKHLEKIKKMNYLPVGLGINFLANHGLKIILG